MLHAILAWRGRVACGVAGLALGLGIAPPAGAYGVSVHAALPRYVFAADGLARLQPAVPAGQLQAFRARFYRTAAALPDVALRTRFLARYPGEATFTPAAFKTFLGLNPVASVWGLDVAPTRATRRGDLLALSATQPDLDARNQARVLRDERGRAVRLADGGLVPIDPMILAIGRSTGLTSQAHAHYGLLPGRKSEDPDVLKHDPRHFAIPADIETFAVPSAQLWTDLAISAAVWDMPTLAVIHEGAFQHYAADVANQVHTVQVGIYDFFFDAKLQSFKEWLVTLGGLRRPPLPFREIGITIVTNYHLLSEEYFVKRLKEVVDDTPRQSPQARRVLAALTTGRAAFDARIAKVATAPDWAAAMTAELVDESSQEGADLFRVTRGMGVSRLSMAGETYLTEEDPDGVMRPPGESGVAEALDRYYALYETAFGRTGSLFRRWERRFGETVTVPGADVAAVGRLVDRQLAYWTAADARRTHWLVGKLLLRPASGAAE
ncbi:MAG: hypothetical protein H7338_10835 [Candidatus Sericytochromatia bacterium]|nr:hypothetical protein [Candidatus Sericytochromatia bacterium]